MMWLDSNKAVLEWSSEEVVIPYRHPFKGRQARYFMDFWWKQRMPDGTVQEFLGEVKPHKQTHAPSRTHSKNGKLLKEAITYAINEAKWEAAEAYATRKGMRFVKITEHTASDLDRNLSLKTPPAIRRPVRKRILKG